MDNSKFQIYKNQRPEELILESQMEGESDLVVLRKLKNAKATGETILGFCNKCQEDGTLEIEFTKNIKGYIPREDVSYKKEKDGKVHLDKARSRVGLFIQCKVKAINEEDGQYKVHLSREEAIRKTYERYTKELKVGMVVKGVVVRFEDYGAFVDIGGDVVGLLGIGKISRVFIDKPDDALQIGQVVDVIISRWEVHENGSYDIEFNRKDLLPTFEEIDEYFKEGETVIGKIKTSIDTGIFVELSDSYEGLAEFKRGRKFAKGENVRVKIVRIDKKREKVKLEIL